MRRCGSLYRGLCRPFLVHSVGGGGFVSVSLQGFGEMKVGVEFLVV